MSSGICTWPGASLLAQASLSQVLAPRSEPDSALKGLPDLLGSLSYFCQKPVRIQILVQPLRIWPWTSHLTSPGPNLLLFWSALIISASLLPSPGSHEGERR